MLNRRIRTSLPILYKLLEAEIPDNIKREKEEVQRKTSYFYNKSAKVLRPLEIGQSVTIRKEKEWEPAVVVKKWSTPRSYVVRTSNEEYRRNRKHLGESLNNPPEYNPDITPEPPCAIVDNGTKEDKVSLPLNDRNVQVTNDRPVRHRKPPIRFKVYIV
ncbi:hypothetical protein Zmor_026372 [Zophobas morio]|uniref:Uncharacterized protein n=1 Tax=Zophobas morio TaxID=2755281 RepID=A0AA38HTH4_9CUCU|nr:hypothetical protein Zmor_026372 [Zophobas morio]